MNNFYATKAERALMKKYRPALRYAWERAPSAPDHSRRELPTLSKPSQSCSAAAKRPSGKPRQSWKPRPKGIARRRSLNRK